MKKRCADLESELTNLRSASTASSLSIGIQTIDVPTDDEAKTRKRGSVETKSTSHMSCDDEDYDIDDVIEELNNIVNSAESDMNASCSSRSSPEQHLVPRYLPRPPPRPDSKPPTLQLDADLNGETSDFPNPTDEKREEQNAAVSDSDAEGPTEISRKKIARTFFGQDEEKRCESEVESVWTIQDRRRASSVDEEIQPDILRAIPTRLFHKSWDVLEARSPMYKEDAVQREAPRRRRHASVDNLCALPRESPVFVHPTVQHPLYDVPPVYRHPERFMEAPGPDLQIGDVFAFNGHFPHPPVRPASAMRKSKRSSGSDSPTNKANSRNSFAFSNLIPGFLKSSFAKEQTSKGGRDEWEPFHTDKALVRDYRPQYHPAVGVVRQSSDPIPKYDMAPEFWPASFQALPYRNIPAAHYNAEPNRNERGRSVPLPSPTQLARDIHLHINRISKLMDHPSGLY